LKRSTQRSTYQFLKKTDGSINPYQTKKVKTVIFSGRKKKLRPKTSYRALSPAPSISLLLPPYLIDSTSSFVSSGSISASSVRISCSANIRTSTRVRSAKSSDRPASTVSSGRSSQLLTEVTSISPLSTSLLASENLSFERTRNVPEKENWQKILEESAYFKRDSFRPITRLAKYQDPAVLAAEKIAAQKNQRNRSQSLFDKNPQKNRRNSTAKPAKLRRQSETPLYMSKTSNSQHPSTRSFPRRRSKVFA